MNSSKSYIIRALHEWISDNDCTPLILVSSTHQGVQIPAGIDEDGKVVLNISYGATSNLELINEGILFDARFTGRSHNLFVPMESILAIYARENGQGMMFADNKNLPESPKPTKKTKPKNKANIKDITTPDNNNFLKVVK
ncbi:Stringent starvation protein B [hydrothermal vent metagenome]|uniref:Stringent starvation protein B n=1 Tax=hydrothermal vent metagenome TaxID=652676 RepID=A0A3B0V3W0_9ZZZZ